VYPKRINIIILPKTEDKKKELSGDIINKIISIIDIRTHIQTFLVAFAYSITIVEEDEPESIIIIYIHYNYFLF
jgi:hypothetical protein